MVSSAGENLTMSGIMMGKRGIVMGVANDRSIAWGIAQNCSAAGAEVILTYQGDILKKRVEELAKTISCPMCLECDAGKLDGIKNAVSEIAKQYDRIDFFVHAIAYADKEDLKGRYVDTSLENFLLTMNISCYSFTHMVKELERLVKTPEGASMLTLSYYGAEKAIPHYNVMGVAKAALESSVRYMAMDLGGKNIRVNALSAGVIRTLASSAIGDFHTMLRYSGQSSLRRNVTQDDISKAALFLLSDLGSGVTGEIVHVDAGYNSLGMVVPPEVADKINKE